MRISDWSSDVCSSDLPFFKDLPGIAVLVGGMWIANLSYWGFNQYIIQRALAAKNLDEAQKGIIFAAFLKLLMPVKIGRASCRESVSVTCRSWWSPYH